MKYAIVLVIGLFAVEPLLLATQARRSAERSGQVRVQGRAVADTAGPFNALGASLFWGAWGMKFDRARLERNLAALNAAGVDYVRVLGSVGGASWTDRLTDPRWDDYDAIIARLTDLAYDRYGMRVQWTLFGGAPFTPPGHAREALVDRFASMARGREHKILAFEIANEAWQNGFDGADGIAELRRLGKRLAAQTTILVALSSPRKGTACETYVGSDADIMTLHYSRSFGSEGPTRPLRRPWASLAGYDAGCRGQLPSVVLNNEPIGPESSVQEDTDPSRIAAAYVMTFLSGNAGYVFHAGPGIRGGGAADRAIGRHANFDEMPSFKGIAAGLAAGKQYLPAGLANWKRHEPNAETAPIVAELGPTSARPADIHQAYGASSGRNFVILALGTRTPARWKARADSRIEVRDPATGKIVMTRALKAGQALTLSGYETLVLIGRT